jgi:hypothetical protein
MERHPDSPGGGPVEEELSDSTRRTFADIVGEEDDADAPDPRDQRDDEDDAGVD